MLLFCFDAEFAGKPAEKDQGDDFFLKCAKI